ncbi:hypothetical protein Dsin_013596 [Dipteronia sinensis]|uniref:Fe2OG dioxygenase domain-containing protein n=1 Tax=Dipteronia sinensis TaxID=43782 RepID=A0AAE0AK94_9ROSI|nr:hypothetical protein Dsin_013596 [Dipteronia sinensis]
MEAKALAKVPVVDFSKVALVPGSYSWLSACNEVRHALEEYGCFVVVYDQIPSETRGKIFDSAKELFDLPIEIKKLSPNKVPHRGYIGENPGFPRHEGMGIENVLSLEQLQLFANNLWPAGNDSFCETVHAYSKKASELNEVIVRMVFDSYGVDKYESHNESTNYLLRLLKYGEPTENETEVGLPPHEDMSFITILCQNHVNGLEIKTKDGEWIGFELTPPSSFIVMAGDALTVWSNDRVRACTHRVVMSGKATRYTAGFFSFSSKILHVPEKLIDQQHPLKYKPFDHMDYVDYFFSKHVGPRPDCRYKAYCGI